MCAASCANNDFKGLYYLYYDKYTKYGIFKITMRSRKLRVVGLRNTFFTPLVKEPRPFLGVLSF